MAQVIRTRLPACMALVVTFAPHAVVAAASSSADNRAAYDASVRCFVANGHAHGQRLRAGDAGKAAYYEAKASASYDAAKVLGTALGLSSGRIKRDLDAAQASELPAMMRDVGYFRSTAAACKAMGLM